MNKKILLFTLAYLSLLSIFAHDKDLFRFIENKNQWNQKVLFKADVPSGVVFLEKNCLTYNFLDLSTLHHSHGGKTKFVKINDSKISGHAFKVHFLNANQQPLVEGENAHEDYYNYFLGNDPRKWASNVLSYTNVSYNELYDGIDLKFYSQNGNLKYDFHVLQGAEPSKIQLKYEGANKIYKQGEDLVIETSIGKIIEKQPYAYQLVNGRKEGVFCSFVVTGQTISFSFPRGYDKNQKLIIDPVLIFSSYSGSSADNFGYTATFDLDGNLYSGSSCFGPGYPTTTGAYQTTFGGGSGMNGFGTDIAITKYDSAGTKQIYSTYLGGDQEELPHSLVVDNENNLVILGTTSSYNFPYTKGCYDSTFNEGDSLITMEGISAEYVNGSDIIISKLNSDGNQLLASTFLGGTSNDGLLALSSSYYGTKTYYDGGVLYHYLGLIYSASNLRYNYADEIRGEIEIDKNNNIYIASCTKSKDFPVTNGAVQSNFNGGNFDAVIVKMSNDLTAVNWSTYLGGNGDDAAYSLELDTLNNVYISGGTTSSNFKTTPGVLFPNRMGGRSDGFITCLDNDGKTIQYSTYFGSSTYDQIYFIDLDNDNNVHVFGQTMAPNRTFVINAAYSNPGSGQFISKLKPDLSQYIWSTVFGNQSGRPNISPTAFLVDLCGQIYLSGWGGTPEHNDFLTYGFPLYPFGNMPLVPPSSGEYYQPTTDREDFYLLVMQDNASKLNYASFYGGPLSAEHVDGGTSRFDKKGKIYQAICAGCGGHSDLPIDPLVDNMSFNCNCGVMKMDFKLPAVVADFEAKPVCAGSATQFVNKSLEQKVTTYQWYFGDGTGSKVKNPTHTYTVGGSYEVTLIATALGSCNSRDTIRKFVTVSDGTKLPVTATADEYTIYKGHSTTLHAYPQPGYLYAWTPEASLSDSKSPNPVATPDTTTTYTIYVSDPAIPECSTRANVKIEVIEIICNEPYIYIPNAFTPDGDSKNDELFVRSNNIASLYFTIYNRWGEKVFETRDQKIGWDGMFKGMKADPGVFDYYLEVVCVDDQKFFKKGNITLIR